MYLTLVSLAVFLIVSIGVVFYSFYKYRQEQSEAWVAASFVIAVLLAYFSIAFSIQRYFFP